MIIGYLSKIKAKKFLNFLKNAKRMKYKIPHNKSIF